MAMDSARSGLPTEDISRSQDLGSSVNPRASIDDYNRVMLQYTQLQMASFTDKGSPEARRNNSGTSGTSGSSAQSTTSSVTNLARTGTEPPPRSNSSRSHTPGTTRS